MTGSTDSNVGVIDPPLLRESREPVAASSAMTRVLDHANRVAKADIAVMISGESGTGKEVIARYLHEQSPRRAGPFIAMNCAAIPESMLEAIIFGHEKGAFTGATERRLGKFELAQGGSLLLDEITEMPLGLQSKLLRVLQEREVERLGSHKVIPVDVRVIATSNRNLAEAVEQGFLREDLYYRLSVFPLSLPPLRERVSDVLPLAEIFLAKYTTDQKPNFTDDAKAALVDYPWPGNVRELENVIQRAILLADGESIRSVDLALDAIEPGRANTSQALDSDQGSLAASLADREERLLLQELAKHSGKRKVTAAALGISERTLRYKIKRLKDRGVQIQ